MFSSINWYSGSRAALVAGLLILSIGWVRAAKAQAPDPAANGVAGAAPAPSVAAPSDTPAPTEGASPPPSVPPAPAAAPTPEAAPITPAPVPASPEIAPVVPVVPPPPVVAVPAAQPREEETSSGPSWLPGWTGTLRRMGQFHEIGVFVGSGGNLAFSGRVSESPQVGLRFLEHHGLITKFTLGLIAAMASSGDRVETGRTVETVGNIRTTTVYSRRKTDAEREAERQMVEDTINGEYVTEFTLYTDGVFGAGSGRAERVRGGDFYLGGNWTGPFIGEFPSVFDAAFVYSYNHASDVLFEDGHRANISFVNAGVMLRYQLPLTSFFEVLVQADVNIYGLLAKKEVTRGHGTPLRLGAYVNLTDRLYARPMISYTTGTSGIGKLIEAGVRF